MAFYDDAYQLHQVFQRLFAQMRAGDPQAALRLERSRLLIRLKCTDPTTDIWINGRRRPLTIQFGHSRLHADLEVALTADTLHQIMLGALSLKQALASGQLEVRGAIWKAQALADLFRQSQAIYPHILRDEGLWPPRED